MPSTTACSYNSADLHRLCQLETEIGNYQGCACRVKWLEEYLDLGLAHANASPNAWQAHCIQRLFNTLTAAINNPRATSAWRSQCWEYLYQPFFVLTQLYQQQPLKKCYLCNLWRRYNAIQLGANKLDRPALRS